MKRGSPAREIEVFLRIGGYDMGFGSVESGLTCLYR
jgi:hypothetical protein